MMLSILVLLVTLVILLMFVRVELAMHESQPGLLGVTILLEPPFFSR
jgi:hypothetical protein